MQRDRGEEKQNRIKNPHKTPQTPEKQEHHQNRTKTRKSGEKQKQEQRFKERIEFGAGLLPE